MMTTLTTPRNFTPGDTTEEKWKVDKDGLAVVHDIYRYAHTGFDTITEDDFMRMKWYGFYRQRPKESGYFMLRLRLPGGQLNSAQMAAVASIAEDYAHGFCDITTRQTFQYHWLRIEQLPDIFARLEAVGMTASGACGDITRNVVGCPVAGIIKDEIIDATAQLREVDAHLVNNPEFSNLPRKYKMSLSGCRIHCAQPDINCVGFFGLERHVGGKLEAGFGVKVGGGLSTAPHLAQALPIFLRPEEVLPAAHWISVVYRDFGFRHQRNKARLKILVADWGAEKYLAKMEELSGLNFQRHHDFVFPHDPETDHLGIVEQKQPGLYFIGICVTGGRIRGSQLRTLGELSAKYAAPGLSAMRCTNKQNLILLNIPEKNLAALEQELHAHGFTTQPSQFNRGCVSCTGMEFCNLAITETKNRMMELVGQMEAEVPGYAHKVRIHFSGCTSSCGQHQIADIGFRGAKTKINGVDTECFDLFLGGKLGDEARFNELVKGKIPSSEIHLSVGKILRYFEKQRTAEELFADFVRRVGKVELKKVLEPAPIPDQVALTN
jgi:ferredoxin-nitrite reductase